jgi:hypothetical protein
VAILSFRKARKSECKQQKCNFSHTYSHKFGTNIQNNSKFYPFTHLLFCFFIIYTTNIQQNETYNRVNFRFPCVSNVSCHSFEGPTLAELLGQIREIDSRLNMRG